MRRASVVLAMLGAATAAGADAPAGGWRLTQGTLAPGREPGSFLLASDAAPGRYSVGEMISREPVAVPFRFSLRWRRLGPEAGRSLHVLVGGGVVLIRSGKVSYYAYDDTAYGDGAWTALPGHRAQDEQSIEVAQDAREVVVTIDGRVAARYPQVIARASTHIGVGMKSAPGFRSKIYVRDLDVRPLQ